VDRTAIDRGEDQAGDAAMVLAPVVPIERVGNAAPTKVDHNDMRHLPIE
jgi:hypothetical protein